jgi:hypothetical protein
MRPRHITTPGLSRGHRDAVVLCSDVTLASLRLQEHDLPATRRGAGSRTPAVDHRAV